MKIKIKQYHGKFRLTFFENYYVFRKRFLKLWDSFVEKGHEKMTVMFIPHNERKIFNFQISKFTISFFLLLFLVVLVTSSYAVIRHAAVKREEQRLLVTYEDIRSHLLRFEKLTNSVSELVEEIKPDVEELYELTAGPEEVDQIWDLDEIDKKDYEELQEASEHPSRRNLHHQKSAERHHLHDQHDKDRKEFRRRAEQGCSRHAVDRSESRTHHLPVRLAAVSLRTRQGFSFRHRHRGAAGNGDTGHGARHHHSRPGGAAVTGG